jgi:hypothetical protein
MKQITRFGPATACLVAALTGAVCEARAQEVHDEDKQGWSNSTELSVAATEGNVATQTFAFKNTLRRHWKRSKFQLKLDGMQANDAEDRFLLVEPGLTWEPGEDPPPFSSTVVEPSLEVDVEKYFLEGKYDRHITDKLFWSTGGSWDRNEDAGILNRFIAFGGLGHVWWKREDLEFSTGYGLSYTDREEDEPDPEKDDRFLGVRLSWDYMNKLGKAVVYKNEFTANISTKDSADYSLAMTNSVGVNLSHHLSLKVSLQWLFENEPALEDVDIVAWVVLNDPDGIPGNGDEFFETVDLGDPGSSPIGAGSGDIRKEELDTIFSTALVIEF